MYAYNLLNTLVATRIHKTVFVMATRMHRLLVFVYIFLSLGSPRLSLSLSHAHPHPQSPRLSLPRSCIFFRSLSLSFALARARAFFFFLSLFLVFGRHVFASQFWWSFISRRLPFPCSLMLCISFFLCTSITQVTSEVEDKMLRPDFYFCLTTKFHAVFTGDSFSFFAGMDSLVLHIRDATSFSMPCPFLAVWRRVLVPLSKASLLGFGLMAN